MKRIMFNDKYGLTKAVLEGRKTMTRRVIKEIPADDIVDISEWGLNDGGKACIALYEGGRPTDIFPAYQPEEVVAVAQSYKSIHEEMMNGDYGNSMYDAFRGVLVTSKAGWNNKMFVRAKLMPHLIRITDIKVERLQDISDEDCVKEGIQRGKLWPPHNYTAVGSSYEEAREAFAALIDKVSGKGTWDKNPYVFVYSFKLVR